MNLSDGVIRLRPWRPDDAPAIADAALDPDIIRWSPLDEGVELWLAQQERPGFTSFAITAADDDAPRGRVHLAHEPPEIGYWVLREHRGQGLAARAVRLMAAWGRERFGLAEIALEVEVDNEPSLRVAAAAGARDTGGLVHEPDRLGVTRALRRLMV